jgi:septum formation protein
MSQTDKLSSEHKTTHYSALSTQHSLVLASSSPRRRELLGRLGLPFVIVPSDVDETLPDGAEPARAAEGLAIAKARAIAATRPGQTVIGADTIVVLDGTPPRILGKPRDDDEAGAMLRALRGRWHSVSTGVAVVRDDQVWHDVVTAGVRMGEFSDAEIAGYVASGEPRDKAGAYAIQGLGGRLVVEVRGSELAVVGLPLRRLAELLRASGVALPVEPEAIVDRWVL